ncbi:MAG: alpha/beta hydrolase [Actinobacteria bacterium]|nr:alpha/beta hydrolase [Actinomycetota bacterium]
MSDPVTCFEVSAGAAVIIGDDAGSGDAVVLLHAGVADRTSWDDVRSVLAGSYRVIAYDRRGFGESTYEAEPFSHVDDLVGVLDERGVERVVLVGNSMGGAVALDTTLSHPDRVLGLVLIGTAASGVPWPPSSPREAELETAAEEAAGRGDIEAANRHEAELWLDGPGHGGRVDAAVRERFLAMNPVALRAPDPGPQSERPESFRRLTEIEVPTLVIVGSLDVPGIVWLSSEVAQRVPHAEFAVMNGVAHLPSLEAPDRLGDLIVGWLDRLT